MPQPDINVAVDYAIAQSGKEYRAYDPDRWWEDYSDCSSLVVKSWRRAGIAVPDSVRNTVGIYHFAKSLGALVSVQKGVATRGAVMLKGRWWGYGPVGHASFSLADGREMAAHGRRTGIGISTLKAGNYHDAVILPNVDYHLGPPPPPPPPPEPTWRLPLIFLTHPDRGTWIVLEGPGGQVSFLSPTGAIVPLGMDQDPADKAAFGNRTIRDLVHRTRNDGKPAFSIVATDNAKYVPKSQI